MCRIAGILHKHNNSDWSQLAAMRDHQRPGGPDASGTWTDDHCGLAHNRLSILDLSENGSQPMESENWVLCYNGEIYNHLQLRKQINRQWKGHSDTETLLYLIETYGLESALDKIEGMYAFGAYNKGSKDLYLVTDQLSIKPLYYALSNGRLLFASSIAAIALQLSKLQLNKQALTDYLALGSTYEPLFQDINKVHPRTIVRVTKDLFVTESKYHPFDHYRAYTEQDCIEAVVNSIESVRLSDVPLFIFLSGGIDSSVVAGCLPGVNAVHLNSPEERYAQQAADKFNTQLSFIDPAEENAEDCLKDYAFQSGDCSMAALIPYITSKKASRFGKVAISANGADEIFVGYDRIKASTTDAQINHIFRRQFYDESSWREIVASHSRMTELDTYLSYDLNKTLDYASMCFGLEVRVPFLNREVIRAAMWLPRESHVNGLGNKSILKKWLLSKGFSEHFVNRQKLGFSLHTEPLGYTKLQADGVKLLSDNFGISPKFQRNSRDDRYFRMSAAAFYCWHQVWGTRLS
ncbi:MAG TPA: asparagine synthase-related protein [Cyclobacteriaceae bacterium]|nr:asparagine synthase-related protein [Cyclobacteriaceae bacterium]